MDLHKQDIEKLHIGACDGNLFTNDIRPILEEHPKIVTAKWLSSGKLMIQMAHLQLSTRIIDFTLRSVPI